jgi:hypothetical protein
LTIGGDQASLRFFNHKANWKIFVPALALLLVFGLLITLFGIDLFKGNAADPKVFVGVDVAYGDENVVYTVAEAISGYANLIIIGSTEVTANTTQLTNVCNYLYQKGFYFIVYVGFSNYTGSFFPPSGPDSSFFQNASSRWGAKFLGAYIFDEAGGKQLDLPLSNPDRPVPKASDYTDAAAHYIINVQSYLYLYKDVFYSSPQMKLYTSDYGLYWFDYISSYDVVFSEIFGNQNDQIAISLCRGAANSQGKDWGTILTFSPSIENSSHTPAYNNVTQFYNSMLLAWQNDAKYIVVFDAPGANHPPTTPYGILTNDHLNAMKNFWKYISQHSEPTKDPAQIAYVLPSDYGFGYRSPNDTIWGIWPADALSQKIWTDTNNLIENYGMKLDIVYENKTGNIPLKLPYQVEIFWNGSQIQGET